MGSPLRAALLFALGTACASQGAIPKERPGEPPGELRGEDRATALARRLMIVDGHVDLPYRLEAGRAPDGSLTEDPTGPTGRGDFDFPRAREGGLDAPFMSIYVPARHQDDGTAKQVADRLIDMVEALARRAPEQASLVSSVAGLEETFRAGRLALLLGIENGAALEDDLANVAHFHARGVRYITLTHSKDNLIGDSSYDDRRTWKGLSPFGRQVVQEMNRAGVIIDVAHVSDQAFEDVLALSEAPVIASHSSCRHFTPGFERNMSDEMIRRMAAKGGVIMINFGSTFISEASRRYWEQRRQAIHELVEARGVERGSPEAEALAAAWTREHPPVLATVKDVADHIDHVVRLVGADHVGFGSDFDGVGETLPVGLEDASKYPNLLRELLARGYSEDDLAKICSGNLLRVWRAVEGAATSP